MSAPYSPSNVVHHVTREETTVTHCLADHFRLEPAKVDELYRLGCIYLEKRRVFEDLKLQKGAYLRIHMKPMRYKVDDIDWRAAIIQETRNFFVVRKPAGIPVHASLDNVQENVLTQIRNVVQSPVLITQRLDVPVGGLLILARTPEFQRDFNRWLGEHKIHKRYRALTGRMPPLGRHVHYMEPSKRSPKTVSIDEKPGWLKCELTIHRGTPDVEIELHTGRTHQIRVQLAALGFPISGDELYGSTKKAAPGTIALYSTEVAWKEAGETWRFKLDPPWARTP